LIREARKNNITNSVSKLVFSDTEKTGIFTSKESAKIVDFVAGLSEVQEKKFFEIMNEVKVDLKKFTDELGTGAAPKTKANSAKALDERATQLMSEKKISKSEAMRLAAKEMKFNADEEDKEDTVA
jgi:hypothetical protein